MSIEKVWDKGISVGEQSIVNAQNINVNDAQIGIVSKDLSKLTISNSRFINIKNYGLGAYQKKPEVGGGSINAENIIFYKNNNKYFLETGSDIILDNIKIEPSIYNNEYYNTGN